MINLESLEFKFWIAVKIILKGVKIMIALNIPEKTARNLLYCLNEVFDNSISDKFRREIIEDKMRIKKAMGRVLGIPESMLTDFRLKDVIKKLT